MLSKKFVNLTFVIVAVVLIATTTSVNLHTSSPSTTSFKYMQISRNNGADSALAKFRVSSFANFASTNSNNSSSTKANSYVSNSTTASPNIASSSSSSADSSSSTSSSANSSHNTKSSKAASSAGAAFFPLTSVERDKVERVVMTSCGGLGNSLMAKANAQVILDRVKSGKFGGSVNAVLDAPHQFEIPWKNQVNTMVKTAVSAVFDRGERVTKAPIYYYENPNLAETSPTVWRQGKQYIMTIGHGIYIHEYWTDIN